MKKTITVIGSCVARDAIEIKQNFSVETDFRFFSPMSMNKKANDLFTINEASFKKSAGEVDGNWYRKNLIIDINKTYFDALNKRHGEYLIIDLAESRIPIAKLEFDSHELFITDSTSFKNQWNVNLKNAFPKRTNIISIDPLDFTFDEWRLAIKDLVTNLLKIFKEKNIILLKTMPAKYYLSKNGLLYPYSTKFHLDNIYTSEILLPRLYEYFLEMCPNCKVIEMPNNAIGDENHKWKNHPFHFCEDVYKYINDMIVDCVDNNFIDRVDIKEKYNKLLIEKIEDGKIKLVQNSSNDHITMSDIQLTVESDELLSKFSKTKKRLVCFLLGNGALKKHRKK